MAVLNASLGENVPINASAIVGDSINEMFVRSPKFQVTDRSALASLQEEKMFQLSGEVSDSDAVDIGKTIGAQYICVSNVNVLGETYSVSARLIEVETAQVINQQTRRLRGGVEVLYDLADLVGGALTGLTVVNAGSSQAAEEPVQEEPVQEAAPVQKQEPVVQTQPDPVYTQPSSSKVKRKSKSHLMFSYLEPVYDSSEWDAEEYPDLVDSVTNSGFDMHLLSTDGNFLYLGLGLCFAFQDVTYTDIYDSSYDESNFILVEPYAGLGAIFSGSFVDFYGGVTVGYLVFTLGDYYGDYSGSTASGVSFGVELGSDLFFGGLGLTLRYRYSSGTLEPDDSNIAGSFDMGYGGFMVGLGFVY
ncbi:MAG: hypothetical protein JXA95_13860 [Spirochaetales bacterium]|nr:hypothetical protein [Spirochaetales bacterium]